MPRHKNAQWSFPDKLTTTEQAICVVLMDIRDELQAINDKLGCYRIPRALDAAIELGADARRRKRNAAKRRKAARG